MFLFEDNYKVYTIFEEKMMFHYEKTESWMSILEYSNENVEYEGFCPFLVVKLVRKYPQAEGVKVHKPPIGSLEEMQYDPD